MTRARPQEERQMEVSLETIGWKRRSKMHRQVFSMLEYEKMSMEQQNTPITSEMNSRVDVKLPTELQRTGRVRFKGAREGGVARARRAALKQGFSNSSLRVAAAPSNPGPRRPSCPGHIVISFTLHSRDCPIQALAPIRTSGSKKTCRLAKRLVSLAAVSSVTRFAFTPFCSPRSSPSSICWCWPSK